MGHISNIECDIAWLISYRVLQNSMILLIYVRNADI